MGFQPVHTRLEASVGAAQGVEAGYPELQFHEGHLGMRGHVCMCMCVYARMCKHVYACMCMYFSVRVTLRSIMKDCINVVIVYRHACTQQTMMLRISPHHNASTLAK